MIQRREVLNPFVRFRSAIDGRFVTRFYALANPSTTVSERRWR